MKNLTQERKDSSVKKWQEIIANIEAKIEMDYIGLYFKPCGFCDATRETQGLDPLEDGEEDNADVEILCAPCALYSPGEQVHCCSNDSTVFTHVMYALFHAQNGFYEEALPDAKRVLDAIKRVDVDTDYKNAGGTT